MTPRELPRFLATTGPADSRPSRSPLMSLRFTLGSTQTPGLPGSSANLSARAVPNHPGIGLTVAYARCFAASGRLPHLWKDGHPQVDSLSGICVTRSNRVCFRYGSRLRFGRLRFVESLRRPLPQLHVERAIYMVSSFQLHKIGQAWPGTPEAQGRPIGRKTSRMA